MATDPPAEPDGAAFPGNGLPRRPARGKTGAAGPAQNGTGRAEEQRAQDSGQQSDQTPAAGIKGLRGLSAPISPDPAVSAAGLPVAHDPLTAPPGEFRGQPNPAPSASVLGTGAAPAAWDAALPTELAARAAAEAAYKPMNPDAPMIGEDAPLSIHDPTPIFDQISVWFTAEPTGSIPAISPQTSHAAAQDVIDLRDSELSAERQPSSRWSSLGDQRWLATNARAAAAPDTEGVTETGLPLRRPGANLLPSASSAAPPVQPGRAAGTSPAEAGHPDATVPSKENPADADLVRGRLGSYQRGLANARKARAQPAPEPAFDPVGASLFTANSDGSDDAGRNDEQGADQ